MQVLLLDDNKGVVTIQYYLACNALFMYTVCSLRDKDWKEMLSESWNCLKDC